MTAKIAYDRLNPRAKKEAVRLMAIPINPSDITRRRLGFFRGSTWPDDVRRSPGFEFSGVEHFADIPFSVDGTPLPPDMPGPANVIKAPPANVIEPKRGNGATKGQTKGPTNGAPKPPPQDGPPASGGDAPRSRD